MQCLEATRTRLQSIPVSRCQPSVLIPSQRNLKAKEKEKTKIVMNQIATSILGKKTRWRRRLGVHSLVISGNASLICTRSVLSFKITTASIVSSRFLFKHIVFDHTYSNMTRRSHFGRKHRIPKHCAICYQRFSKEKELSEHIQARSCTDQPK